MTENVPFYAKKDWTKRDISCEARIDKSLESDLDELREFQRSGWGTNAEGYEFFDHGLAWDFNDDLGAFVYLLGCGGPQREFRFTTDHNKRVRGISYHFMDWFDHASRNLSGADFDLLADVFEVFEEVTV